MSDSDETAAAAAALAGRLQHGVAGPLDTIAARLDALMVMTPDALRAEVDPLGFENGLRRSSKQLSPGTGTRQRHKPKKAKSARRRR